MPEPSKLAICRCADTAAGLMGHIKDLMHIASTLQHAGHIVGSTVAPVEEYESWGHIAEFIEMDAKELKEDCDIPGGYLLNRMITFKDQMQNHRYKEAESTAEDMDMFLRELLAKRCEDKQ
jgi:hypothetical protein